MLVLLLVRVINEMPYAGLFIFFFKSSQYDDNQIPIEGYTNCTYLVDKPTEKIAI